MTDEQRHAIEALQGRDLDAAIAEHVMGYRPETVGKDAKGEHGGGIVLVPPTWGDDWWKYLPLVGKVHRGFFARQWHDVAEEAINLIETRFPLPRFHATLHCAVSNRWRCDIETSGGDGPTASGSGETIPLAICRAALAVVGYGKDEQTSKDSR